MSKTAILVCGNSGIDYENVNYPFRVVHSKLIIDRKEYEDFVDMKADEFYDIIAKNPDIPLSTTQASTGELLDIYEQFKKEGYSDVLAISISSKLSGTYQNMVLASQMIEGLKVHVVDSYTVSYGQMFLVHNAIAYLKEGLSPEAIVSRLDEDKKRIQIYVLVDTLKFLVKNGRLSATSGAIGSLLKIKPLLNFTEDGRLVPYEKIRTSSKARARFIDIAKQEIAKGVTHAFLAYTNNKAYVEEIKLEIQLSYPNLDIKVIPLTPVVGAHAGPGTCGFGVIRK